MKKFSEYHKLNEKLGEDLWDSKHTEELKENITRSIETFFSKIDESNISYDIMNESDDREIEEFISEVSLRAFQSAYLEKMDNDNDIGTYTDFEELPKNENK